MKNLTSPVPKIEIFSQKEMVILQPQGFWTAKTAQDIEKLESDLLEKAFKHKIIIDLSQLHKFDTAGIWLLHRISQTLSSMGHSVTTQNESEAFKALSLKVEDCQPSPEKLRERPSFIIEKLIELGMININLVYLTRDLILFLGQIVFGLLHVIVRPKRLRFTALVSHMERVGVDSIPIVSIMAISLGIVLAYQGEEQLRRFGAEIYTINLVSISILREVGILITAILIAGRSGSAITAELGIMKINQEIDALNTLGLNPMYILIIPRVLALIIVMPMLAFISDIAGLIGGGIMVIFSLNVSPLLYVHRIAEAVTMGSFWVGILKAPLFGAIIGVVSCFEGMRVKGTAESVGECTTRSVVEGIFLVTIADALLSIFFAQVGI